MENNKSNKKKPNKSQNQKDKNKPDDNKKISSLLEINTEFDESISFSHYCSIYRKFGIEKQKPKIDYIPFIMTVEFTYSYSEEIRTSKEVDKQSIETITSYIKKFQNSKDEKYNKTFLDNIKTFSEIIGIEKTSNLLIPALARIVDDTFLLKNHFLKVLLPFIDYLCSNGDEGVKILKNNMMNIIQELYHPRNKRDIECYKNEDYQNLLFKNFIKIAKALIPKDKDKQILSLILSFGYEDEKNAKKYGDEHVVLCVKLISELTEIYGKESTENYLLPQLIYFADDKKEKVKKEVLLALPNICDVVSFEVISTKIYDLIKRVLNVLNPSWVLKKILVDVLAKIIKTFKYKSQEDENENSKNKSAKKFVSLIEKLIQDKEKYVCNNILEKIGPIIEPLNKEELSLELLKFYKKSVEDYYIKKKKQLPSGMTVGNSNMKKKSIDNDEEVNSFVVINNNKSDNEIEEIKKKLSEENMGYYFAYNFPAILYCYGKEHWSELKSIYIDFCFEVDTKIRRLIIVSFHEISKIIGQTITENELLPIYDTFLNSNDKIERNLAIRYLPKILMQVSKEKKKRYFKYLEAASIFIDNIGSKVRNFNFINWKNKLDVIEGILCYYNLYENDIIYKSIFPQCISFCLDDIYKVRKTSSKVLASLIDYLYNVDYKKEQLFKLIDSFALHKKFHQRINFVKMCKIFLKNKKLYEEKIKNLLNELVDHEKIKDVKICLSKVLKKIIGNDKEILYKDQNIHQICYKLKMEDLPIINNIFSDVNIKYNIIKIDNKNNNKINDKTDKYFKGNNEFFMQEFKIELEKKSSIFFLDRSNKKLVQVKSQKKQIEPKKVEENKNSNENKEKKSENNNEIKKEENSNNSNINSNDSNDKEKNEKINEQNKKENKEKELKEEIKEENAEKLNEDENKKNNDEIKNDDKEKKDENNNNIIVEENKIEKNKEINEIEYKEKNDENNPQNEKKEIEENKDKTEEDKDNKI